MNDAVQPVKRQWRSIGFIVAVCGLLIFGIVIGALLFKRGHSERAKPVDVGQRTVSDKLIQPDFDSGYRVPPPPAAPPPVVAQPAAISAPPPVLPPAAAPKQPLRPLASMFSTEADQTAFVDNISAAGGPGLRQQTPVGGNSGRTSKQGKWLAEAGTGGDDIVTSPYLPPLGRYIIQAGTIISATTLNETNSDLPGNVVAIINDDVRDTPTGRVVLIPAGSKLWGVYADELEFGQSRAQISWQRVLFPNGNSQSLGSMAGTDAAGAAGVEGDVNRHPWSMAGAILFSAFTSIIGQTGQLVTGGAGTTNIGSVGAAGAGQQAETIGSRIISKELDRKNTLVLKQGTQVAVMVSRDIVTLTPYSAGEHAAN